MSAWLHESTTYLRDTRRSYHGPLRHHAGSSTIQRPSAGRFAVWTRSCPAKRLPKSVLYPMKRQVLSDRSPRALHRYCIKVHVIVSKEWNPINTTPVSRMCMGEASERLYSHRQQLSPARSTQPYQSEKESGLAVGLYQSIRIAGAYIGIFRLFSVDA